MRADLLTPVVEAAPGVAVHLELEVLNNGTIIDEVTCALPGLAPDAYEQTPPSLRLFPGEHGRVDLFVHLPATYPAGRHVQAVQVQGSASGTSVQTEARLDVRPVVKPLLTVSPDILTGRKKARYEVTVGNAGNAPLDVTVQATDANQLLRLDLEQAVLHVPAGERLVTTLVARRRRRWFGPPVLHPIVVQIGHDREVVAREVQFRQKPRVPSGALTAAMLMVIVALWAVAVLFGVKAAMSEPPLTKLLPEKFAQGVDPTTLDVSLVGSPLSGKVLNEVTGKPLPRVTVELFDADGRLTAASATKDDGSWEVPAVLPGAYKVRFHGEGLSERWYPAAADAAGAELVTVLPATPLGGLDIAVAGGSGGGMNGVVVTGDAQGVAVTVTVEPVDATEAARAGFPREVTASSGQPFTVPDLPSPANYRVRLAAPGFQTQELEQAVPAGATVQLNATRLLAAAGVVGGTVVDRAGTPLGEVAVSTKIAGEEVKVLTPTAGTVGQFRLTGLPTPGTYVLTLAKEGYSSEVVAVRLDAGQERLDVNVTLAAASGTVTGIVKTAGGTGIGGVTVTVVGDAAERSTTTFTNGTVGGYRLSGLPLPGRYSITFSLDGYRTETMQVTVARDQTEVSGDITLVPVLGRITGTVLDTGGRPVGGASIRLADGIQSRTTATATAPDAAVGTFDLPGLATGSYTLTVSAPGYRDQTLLVTVTADTTLQRTISLVVAP